MGSNEPPLTLPIPGQAVLSPGMLWSGFWPWAVDRVCLVSTYSMLSLEQRGSQWSGFLLHSREAEISLSIHLAAPIALKPPRT